MPLCIEKIELRDFRNYAEFSIGLSSGLSVVVGPNAVGKTNFIEAIQLVTAGESFRRPRWGDVVRQGADSAKITMRATGDNEVLDVGLVVANNRRSYVVNEKKKRPLELLGKLPCVVFTPDDLFMVKGPAEERRRTLDDTGDQISTSYAELRARYGRLLKQRNAALKKDVGTDHIVVITEQLVAAGARLTAHRARLVAKLAEQAAAAYAEMAPGELLCVELVPSWARYGVGADPASEDEAAVAISRALSLSADEEIARQTTTAGPHRDDIRFSLDGKDVRVFGSQGQQRSVALAWKLAEVRVISDILSKRPILLLDDVMSELDKTRRAALTRLLSSTTQTVITTANLQYFERDMLNGALVVELSA